MELLVNLPWSRKGKKLVYNPHFWVLVLITILISLLYYSGVFLSFRPDWLWHLIITEFKYQFSGILFFIPLIYTAAIFWWRGTFIMWLISIAISSPIAFYYRPYPLAVLANIFYLCIPLLLVGYITLELNWRNRERRTIIERETERQVYIAQILQAQEEERKRIAHELHDDTIHSLLVIASKVQDIGSGDGKVQTREQLNDQSEVIRGEIIHVCDELRRLTLDLRPGILDNIGFLPALRWLVDRLNQEGQIEAKMVVKGGERNIPHKIDVIMFRIIQEALNNIRRHSEATKAMITLEFGDETVKISVSDNGKGFKLPTRFSTFASQGQLGLVGIQERVHSLNGKFNLKSKSGHGTVISVKFKM